jgi:hypothetical protein
MARHALEEAIVVAKACNQADTSGGIVRPPGASINHDRFSLSNHEQMWAAV